jgi:hypothetical protein
MMHNIKVALLIVSISILIDGSIAHQRRLRRTTDQRSKLNHISSHDHFHDDTTNHSYRLLEPTKNEKEEHFKHDEIMTENKEDKEHNINELVEMNEEEVEEMKEDTKDDDGYIAARDEFYKTIMAETGILPVVLEHSEGEGEDGDENKNEDDTTDSNNGNVITDQENEDNTYDIDNQQGAEDEDNGQEGNDNEVGDDNENTNTSNSISNSSNSSNSSNNNNNNQEEEDDQNTNNEDVTTSSPTSAPTHSATEWPTAAIQTDSPTKIPSKSPTTHPKTISPTISPTTIPTKSVITTSMIRGNGGKKNKNKHHNDDDGLSSPSPTKSPIIPPTTYPSSKPTPSPTKIKDPSQIYNNLPDDEKEYIQHQEIIDEEKEAAKISIGFIFLTLTLMICTAQQMSENPDGVYANVCRLAITVTSCVFKMILFPFRKVLGLNNNGGYAHHLVTTQEFRDPYSRSNRMEFL